MRQENAQWEGWVFAGCGARGTVQAGMAYEMLTTGLSDPPVFIAGCSAGALNAAGLAHTGPIGLRDFWLGIKGERSIFSLDLNPFKKFRKSLKNPAPLFKLITEAVSHRPLMCPYSVTVSDLRRKKAVSIHASNARISIIQAEWVLASASIPVIFPCVHGRYVDGGLFDVAPLKTAIDVAPAEGGRVTLFLGENLERPTDTEWTADNIVKIGTRSVEGIMQEVLRNDIAECLYQNSLPGKKPIALRIFQPSKDFWIDTLDFDAEKIRSGFEHGRDVASRDALCLVAQKADLRLPGQIC